MLFTLMFLLIALPSRAQDTLASRLAAIRTPIVEREAMQQAMMLPTPIEAQQLDQWLGLTDGRVRGHVWISEDRTAALSDFPASYLASPQRPLPRRGLRLRSYLMKFLDHVPGGDYVQISREIIIPVDFPELGSIDVIRSFTFESTPPFAMKAFENDVGLVGIINRLMRTGGPVEPGARRLNSIARAIEQRFSIVQVTGNRRDRQWHVQMHQSGNPAVASVHDDPAINLMDFLGAQLWALSSVPTTPLRQVQFHSLQPTGALPFNVVPSMWRVTPRPGGGTRWTFGTQTNSFDAAGTPVMIEGETKLNTTGHPVRFRWHLSRAMNHSALFLHQAYKTAPFIPTPPAELPPALANARDATFSISISTRRRGSSEPFESLGNQTAFFVSNSGYAITAAHGFYQSGLEHRVAAPALLGMPGQLVLRAVYPSTDMAILQFQPEAGSPSQQFPCIPAWSSIDMPELGTPTVSFGFPQPFVTRDVLRSSAQITGQPIFREDGRTRIQLDSPLLPVDAEGYTPPGGRIFSTRFPVMPGNSGGPLVSMNGLWLGNGLGGNRSGQSLFVSSTVLNSISPQYETAELRNGPALRASDVPDIRECTVRAPGLITALAPEWDFTSYEFFVDAALQYFDQWLAAHSNSRTPRQTFWLRRAVSRTLEFGWLFPRNRIPGTWAASVPFNQVLDRFFEEEERRVAGSR